MRHFYVTFFSFLVFCHVVKAQQPLRIELTFNKTVHLVFPEEVSYVDVGSNDVLVDQKKDMVKLAVKNEGFSETNLTVVTADNVWYTFLLDYEKDIKELTYFIKASQGKRVEGGFAKNGENMDPVVSSQKMAPMPKDSDYLSHCRQVVSRTPSYWDVGAVNKKIFLAVNNIFIHNDKLYFVVSVGNASNINYDIDFLKMSVVDKRKLKKSSIQEDIKEPLFVYNGIEVLPGNTKTHFMVFVFDKFTIPDDRKLVFELYEKKGGRNISFDIKKDLISRAVPIYK